MFKKTLQPDYSCKVLITHFDEDHYNGFLNFYNSKIHLDKLYLPYYFYLKHPQKYKTGQVYQGAIATSLYLFLLNKTKHLATFHKLFLSICKSIANNQISAQDIIPLYRGNTFKLNSATFEVLWPPHNEIVSKELNYYNEQLHNIIVKYSHQEIDLVNNVIGQYLKAISVIYNSFSSEDISSKNEDFKTMEEALGIAYQELEESRRYFLGVLKSKSDQSCVSTLNNAQYEYLCDMNACSTVFQNGNEALFTGDITKEVISLLKTEKRIESKYKVLKVPHHGTSAYYSADLPLADHYIISNAGQKYKNWAISEKYSSHFVKSKVHCTNENADRCELRKGGHCSCDSKSCNFFHV